ncbi:MAG: hypothetical protein K5840_00995 [Eubacterium sp.]|nr:hypothetical protein [Eubacterium sp.]
MTATVFCVLWACLSLLTGLVTQAIKNFIDNYDEEFPSNIVALVVALVLGITVTALYYLQTGVDFTPLNIIYLFVMGFLNWIGASVGYDKVKEALSTLVTVEGDDNDDEEEEDGEECNE